MSEEQEMKDCPFCGEKILAKAVKCKYCKSDLTPKESTTSNDEPNDKEPIENTSDEPEEATDEKSGRLSAISESLAPYKKYFPYAIGAGAVLFLFALIIIIVS